MVVGHTVQQQGITSACDGKLWRIDVGLAEVYGGPIEVLEVRRAAVDGHALAERRRVTPRDTRLPRGTRYDSRPGRPSGVAGGGALLVDLGLVLGPSSARACRRDGGIGRGAAASSPSA